MRLPVIALAVMLALLSVAQVFAQTKNTNEAPTDDSTIGVKPTIKIESLSAPGHCDNQQLTFLAPWADHFEIEKRRSDTAWIKGSKPSNAWLSQTLKPGINSMIYKHLDEQGTYQFIVKAFKGNRYRQSDTMTIMPCIGVEMQK